MVKTNGRRFFFFEEFVFVCVCFFLVLNFDVILFFINPQENLKKKKGAWALASPEFCILWAISSLYTVMSDTGSDQFDATKEKFKES